MLEGVLTGSHLGKNSGKSPLLDFQFAVILAAMKAMNRLIIYKDGDRWKFPLATWFCAVAPWVLLINVALLALHVWLGLGRWPAPMIDNYNTLAFQAHSEMCVLVCLFTLYGAGPLFFVLLCFRVFRLSLKYHLVQAGVFAAGWGVLFLWAAWDPGRFIEWFKD